MSFVVHIEWYYESSPRHSRHFTPIERHLERFVQRGKFRHTLIGIVFPVPDGSIGPIRLSEVFIGQDVLARVPSTETEIQAAHECDGLVDDAHLFVLPRQLSPGVKDPAKQIRLTCDQ